MKTINYTETSIYLFHDSYNNIENNIRDAFIYVVSNAH